MLSQQDSIQMRQSNAVEPQLGIASFSLSNFPIRLLQIMIVLPIVTFGTTYPLAFLVNDVKQTYPGLFLSGSINYPPSSCIGGFGLSLTCFGLCLVVFCRFARLRSLYYLHTNDIDEIQLQKHHRIRRFNKWLLALGVLSAIGGNGVAAIQFHSIPVLHHLFAATFFGSALLYMTMSLYLEPQCEKIERSSLIKFIRIFSTVFGWISLIMTLSMAGLMKCDTCRFVAALAEISMFVAFEMFFASFMPEFRGFTIELTAPSIGQF